MSPVTADLPSTAFVASNCDFATFIGATRAVGMTNMRVLHARHGGEGSGVSCDPGQKTPEIQQVVGAMHKEENPGLWGTGSLPVEAG